MPFAFIPFLLLVVPIVEIAAFIVIGQYIGLWPTLAMILVTAIAGTFLLRQQGLQLLTRIRTEMDQGKVPGRALGDAACILVAGILLLTPGFVTDALGFLLFLPPVRRAIWTFLASRITVVAGNQTFSARPQRPHGRGYEPRDEPGGPVIDLDEEDYTSGPPNPDSPWNDKRDG